MSIRELFASNRVEYQLPNVVSGALPGSTLTWTPRNFSQASPAPGFFSTAPLTQSYPATIQLNAGGVVATGAVMQFVRVGRRVSVFLTYDPSTMTGTYGSTAAVASGGGGAILPTVTPAVCFLPSSEESFTGTVILYGPTAIPCSMSTTADNGRSIPRFALEAAAEFYGLAGAGSETGGALSVLMGTYMS